MTLAVGVATPDGVVIAADSRTSNNVRVITDFTHKVFQVGGCAVGTAGLAFVEGKNISGKVIEFRTALAEVSDPSEVAARLSDHFGPKVDAEITTAAGQIDASKGDVLTFLVGGYHAGFGSIYEVGLPSRTIQCAADSSKNPGALWRGQWEVFQRLVNGIDGLKLTELVQGDPAKQAALSLLQPDLEHLKYFIPWAALNLQDAIDFARLAIRTTIDIQRLTHGYQDKPFVAPVPGVGGPIEIAAVKPTGFQWVQQTLLDADRPAGSAVKA